MNILTRSILLSYAALSILTASTDIITEKTGTDSYNTRDITDVIIPPTWDIPPIMTEEKYPFPSVNHSVPVQQKRLKIPNFYLSSRRLGRSSLDIPVL